MPEYFIRWEIDLYADSPRAAAEECLRILQDPNTTAVLFDVTDQTGETTRVDLLEEEES